MGGGTPPGPNPGAAGNTGDSAVLAISHLYLGDTDRAGNPSPTAWKQYGFNIDHTVSTKTSSDVCKLAIGANPTNVKTDGPGGIDNSFGSNIAPLSRLRRERGPARSGRRAGGAAAGSVQLSRG